MNKWSIHKSTAQLHILPSPSPAHPSPNHLFFSYPRNQLPNHSCPGAIGLRNTIHTIPDQVNLVVEAKDLCQLLEHVHTEALVAVIAFHFLVVPLQHQIWVFLQQNWAAVILILALMSQPHVMGVSRSAGGWGENGPKGGK